jgi:hypothetical protein
LYGVYEENNQQNNLRDYLVRALYSNEKDKDSEDSQRVIANRLTSQQAL